MLTTGEKRYESRKDIKEKHLVKLSSKYIQKRYLEKLSSYNNPSIKKTSFISQKK